MYTVPRRCLHCRISICNTHKAVGFYEVLLVLLNGAVMTLLWLSMQTPQLYKTPSVPLALYFTISPQVMAERFMVRA